MYSSSSSHRSPLSRLGHWAQDLGVILESVLQAMMVSKSEISQGSFSYSTPPLLCTHVSSLFHCFMKVKITNMSNLLAWSCSKRTYKVHPSLSVPKTNGGRTLGVPLGSGISRGLCCLCWLALKSYLVTSSLNVAISASPRGKPSLAFHKILLLLLKC